MISIKAPAKINLNLHVGGPCQLEGQYRGYHELNSLVTFCEDCFDTLEIYPAEHLSMEIKGEFAEELGAGPHEYSNNLVLKAARLMQERLGVNKGARIILEKDLPIASGIGGGSSDCAATIIGLNRLWGLGLSLSQMANIGQEMGSDIPACLKRHALIMKGFGEIIESAPLMPAMPALLLNPLSAMDTKLVYKKYDSDSNFPEHIDANYCQTNSIFEATARLKALRNDLQSAAISIMPQIEDLLQFLSGLEGQLMCRMSGSGATCFAIFDTLENARRGQKLAIDNLGGKHTRVWAKATMLMANGHTQEEIK